MGTDILKLDMLEQRFNSLFEEAPFSAALLAGDNFRIEMANSISLQLWGKTRSIIGKPLLEAIPEIRDQELFKILGEVYRSGNTYEGKEQIAFVRRDSELKKVYLNFVYKAIKDTNRNVTGVLAIGHDVTDIVIARQKLQQSETRTKVAIESTGLGTFELNYKTGETTTSSRFNEIFGFDRPGVHEQYVERIHPEDMQTRNEAHQLALKTGKLRYEARVLLPDKSIRWIKIQGSIIFDVEHSPDLLIGTILDITEEKLSFEKLQESEERFRTLITETPEVAIGLYLGRELRIQYVNDVMLRFWGKDGSVIGKTWRQALPELESLPFLNQLDEVFTTGVTFTGKEVKAILERNGVLQVGYYNYTFKALKNLHGEIYGIHHMAVDVTEQVKNKLTLIESEETVRALFEQTPVGIAMFKGEELKIELVNDTLLRYWAKERKEVINRPLWEVFPEVAQQGMDKITKQVLETGVTYTSPETPVDLFRGGKLETIIVDFAFQALKDWQGKIIGLLVIANDVTELVTARKKVEKNEMRLKSMADAMPQVVWIGEQDGKVRYYNKRVLQFAGVRQDEEGNYSISTGLVHPKDLRSTAQTWMKSVKTKAPYQMEHRIKMNDGEFRWHLSRAYAYETEDGTKWYGTSTDVHDQKLLEMGLESIVRERTLELQRSNDDLQQFAHVASHDLKEPVRKIKTFSYILQDEYRTMLGERGNHYINKIINASDRMHAMINGVLNYASMSAYSSKFERVDLTEVVHNIQTDLEILIQEKEATITPVKLPAIHGMADLIYQLFYNLINNSLKFSKPNTPAVIHIACEQELTIQEKTFYEIILTDNGIGFKQEFAEQIFSSFFRLNSKDQYEGSGLGLALCKKIVERHGGWITAVGETNKGAQFHIFLPK